MTIRVSCGSVMGTQLHLVNSEPLCSTCTMAERARSVEAERKIVTETPEQTIADLIRDTVHTLAVAMGTPANV